MARKPRILYPGALYHVYNRGNDRHPIFRDDDDRTKYLWYFAKYAREMSVVLIAYCLLTNHFHFFLQTLLANLPKFMHRLNLGYVKWYNKKRNRTGHLYTSRYQASLVQEGSHALNLSGYIHLNPVRAGLVDRPEEWPWSTYQHYTGADPIPFVDSAIILDQFGSDPLTQQKAYETFALEGLDKGTAWTEPPVKAGLFLADDEFIKQICEKYGSGDPRIPRWRTIEQPDVSTYDLLDLILKESGTPFATLKESKRHADTYWRNMFIFLARELAGTSATELSALLGLSISEISRLTYRFQAKASIDETVSRHIEKIASTAQHRVQTEI